MAKPLAEIIAATNMVGTQAYLLTDYGKPFKTAQGFANYFKDRCRDAGLPHCSPHGLRKAFTCGAWPRWSAPRTTSP
jgi:hypothetical protein